MSIWVKRAARSTSKGHLVLLGVLVAVGAIAGLATVALGASGPPVPTITASPAAVSNNPSPSFSFSGAPAGGSYQCKRDAEASFVACVSPKSYAGLAAGSHTFQVRGVDNKGKTGDPATFTWTIDLTAPTVSSIVRVDANPRNAGPLHWTVTFSEPVNGAAASNFALATSNVGGAAPTISSVVASGSTPTATWTVTVATTGTTGLNNGSIGLNLSSVGAIKDVATNALTGVPVTGQAYNYDTTAPTTLSANRVGASPTNAASVSWTVVFSESITGVATGNFSLVASGFTGTPAVTGVTGSGSTYTVTASTGTGTTTNTASLQLRLATVGSIKDLALNALTGVPFNGQSYTVDRLAPPVAFGTKPPDPSSTSTSNFTWTQTPVAADFDHYACSTENGAFGATVQSQGGPAQACASPLTYVVGVTNNGQHQLAVRAYDTLGNFTEISWTWKVAAGTGQSYTISGTATGLLYPTSAATGSPINLAFNNPNAGNGGSGVNGVRVSNLSVSIVSIVAPNATVSRPCGTVDFAVTQFSGTYPFYIPQGTSSLSTLTPAIPTSQWPTIRLVNRPVNQDGCKGATINLSYAGTP